MDLAISQQEASQREASELRVTQHTEHRRIEGGFEGRGLSLAVFFLGLAVLVARNPASLGAPHIWAEDGTTWFYDAYTTGWFSPLFVPYGSYLQTLPRLCADIGLALPLMWLPWVFASLSLLFQVMPAVLIVSTRSSKMIPQIWVRLIIGALYLSLPNSYEVNANLSTAQWHLALSAFIILVTTPSSRRWRYFDVPTVALCGLTGPFSLPLLLVAVVLRFHRKTSATIPMVVVLGCTSVLQTSCLLLSPRNNNVPLGATLPRFVEIVGGQIAGGTFLGVKTLVGAENGPHFLLVSSLCLAVVAAVLVCVLLRAPFELRLFNLFSAAVLAASLISPVDASSGGFEWLSLSTNINSRYWFFPTAALIVDVIWMAGRRRYLPFMIPGALLTVTLLSFGVREDWRYPPLPAIPWVSQIHHFETLQAGQSYDLTIDPLNWKMILVKK